MNIGELKFGVGVWWLVGAQNSLLSAAVEKQWSLAAIGFHKTVLQSSSIKKKKKKKKKKNC